MRGHRVLASIVAAGAIASSTYRGPAAAAGMTVVPATPSSPALSLYVARPRHGAGPFPAVVVLPGCEGFNGFYAVTADRLAMLGYVAVAPDPIGTAGTSDACDDRSGSVTEAADARRALAWLRAEPGVDPARLGLLGFSMGGIALLDVVDPSGPASSGPGLRAAVAYYPFCAGRGASVAVPLAIFDGSGDEITPAAPCVLLATAATSAGHPVEITTYPGATHAFAIPTVDTTFRGQPLRYDRDAADAADRATAAFFAKYLGGRALSSAIAR